MNKGVLSAGTTEYDPQTRLRTLEITNASGISAQSGAVADLTIGENYGWSQYTNCLSIYDGTVQGNTDVTNRAAAMIYNARTHNVAGVSQGLDSDCALAILNAPTALAGITTINASGVSVRGFPTNNSVFSSLTAFDCHWDSAQSFPNGTNNPAVPTTVTAAELIGGHFHLGALTSTVTDAVGLKLDTLALNGWITNATGLKYRSSQGQRTWGFRIGGIGGDFHDAWHSHHMGAIALGGTPGTSTIGSEFPPIDTMLDIREVRPLVHTASLLINNSATVNTDPNTGTFFDFANDTGAAITGTGIPGGTTISILLSPTSAILSAATTGGAQTVTATITKPLADQYSSGIKMIPGYDQAATVTRHTYIRCDSPVLTNSAAVTDAAVLRFDAAPGTHKALASNSTVAVTLGSTGPTGSTAGAPQGWMKINVNGTLRYIPFW